MNWAKPEMLYLLFLIPIFIIVHIIRILRRKRVIRKVFNGNPSPFEINRAKETARFILLLLSFIFMTIASARPRWGEKPEVKKGRGIDIIFCVDVSKSMLCEDVKPTRLDMAKLGARVLAEETAGNRFGLVAFAGDAYLLCPLTSDLGILSMYLDILKPENFPVPGTNIGRAIDVATDAFDKNSTASKVIVIFSDGENLTGAVEPAIKRAISKGIRIFTIGVGTKDGAPVPEVDSLGNIRGYKKINGKPVISKPNPTLLMNIGLMGKGGYAGMNTSNLMPVIQAFKRLRKGEFGEERYLDLQEKYHYFLIVALVFLVAGIIIGEAK